eukprot:TRINITY_DN26192_c0_g1_i1.p1 TRINITY_DN26192_c0_g1~~TRINITY_DN26192_c0_g1_i1.p1  ORF type:complete len:761 (+),score=289.09 TRINITY_DN26192_c0_g1_i1:77-2359(+)
MSDPLVRLLTVLLGGGPERAAAEASLDAAWADAGRRGEVVTGLLRLAGGADQCPDSEAALAAIILSNRLSVGTLPAAEQRGVVELVASAIVAGGASGRSSGVLKQLAELSSAFAQARAGCAGATDPEPLQAASALIGSANGPSRAVGWWLAASLVDGLGARLSGMYGQLMPAVAAACRQEQHPTAAAEALRCAGVILGGHVWDSLDDGVSAAACADVSRALVEAAAPTASYSAAALSALASAAPRLSPEATAAAHHHCMSAMAGGGEAAAAAGAEALAALGTTAAPISGAAGAETVLALLRAAERDSAPPSLAASCRHAVAQVVHATAAAERVTAVAPLFSGHTSTASFELLAAAAEPAADVLRQHAPHLPTACAEAVAASACPERRTAAAEALAALAEAFAADDDDEAPEQSALAAALPVVCRALVCEADPECALAISSAARAICAELDSAEASAAARSAVPDLLRGLQAGATSRVRPEVVLALLRTLAAVGQAACSFAGLCPEVAAGTAPLLDVSTSPPELRAAALDAAAAVLCVSAGAVSAADSAPETFTALAAHSAAAALRGSRHDEAVLAALRVAGQAALAFGDSAAELVAPAIAVSLTILSQADGSSVETGSRAVECGAAECIGQCAAGAAATFASAQHQDGGSAAAAAVSVLVAALGGRHPGLVAASASAIERVVRTHAPSPPTQGPGFVAGAAEAVIRALSATRTLAFRVGWRRARAATRFAAEACVDRLHPAHPLVAPLRAAVAAAAEEVD